MREIGDLAMSAGWDCYIAYSRARDGIKQHSSKLIPIGNKLDLVWHGLMTRVFDAHGLASRRSTNKLIQRIREIDPDIIHIHNIHGYFLNYPLLCDYLREAGKPVIWTMHDCWLYTGHCYYYSAAGCDLWKTGCHSCPNKHRFPASYVFDRSRRNYLDKKRCFTSFPSLSLVAVSKWIGKEASQSFLKDKPCMVIPNGIDLDIFKPVDATSVLKDYGISSPCYYLAVASIWLPEKGFSDLISLTELLSADEQLVMVGKMTKKQKASLPDGVITIERTSDTKALAALYSGATAFINPTWQDNYPTVNLESIACGTPVVTYNTGGSGESVTAETGIIVNQGDVKALAAGVHMIRKRNRDTWLTTCRNYALQHFDKRNAFRSYLNFYDDLTQA